jgi:hypothetical protein
VSLFRYQSQIVQVVVPRVPIYVMNLQLTGQLVQSQRLRHHKSMLKHPLATAIQLRQIPFLILAAPDVVVVQ